MFVILILFDSYLVSLYILSGLGQIFGANAGTFFNMVSVLQHVLCTSGMNYVAMLFVSIGGIAVDIAGKVFSNLYYPSQTQKYLEDTISNLETWKIIILHV